MKRAVSVVIAILLIVMMVFTTSAAEPVKPVVEILKYNGEEYVLSDTFASGDLILVRIKFNQSISSLASLRVKLDFDSKKMSYVGGSFQPELVMGDSTAGEPILNMQEGTVMVFFGKGGLIAGDTDEILTGRPATNIACFVFKLSSEKGEAKFTATIDNALTADYKELAMAASTASKSIDISKWQLSDNAKKVFEKIVNVSYNPLGDPSLPEDSMAHIEAAEAIYKAYSAIEKNKFALEYPELFEAYRTARTRYYDLGFNASQEQIKAEAKRYRDKYQKAYNLDGKSVNLSNYKFVREAIDAWNSLDEVAPQATLLLLDEKAKLDVLEPIVEKLENMVKADAEAQEWFIDRYQNILWNASENSISTLNYGEYMEVIASAMSDYDSLLIDDLSDAMRKKVNSYYKKLLKLNEQVQKAAKEAGEETKIQDEIASFTKKWLSVTRLTIMTAGVKDITALEMFLQDFSKLSKIAQTRLSNRKVTAEQLLKYVKGLSDVQGNTNNDTSNNNEGSNTSSNNSDANNVVSTVPQGGTTSEVIKEIIKEVPVETVVENTKNNAIFRDVPTIVYVSILLMGMAVLIIPIPLLQYRRYYKAKHKKEGDQK